MMKSKLIMRFVKFATLLILIFPSLLPAYPSNEDKRDPFNKFWHKADSLNYYACKSLFTGEQFLELNEQDISKSDLKIYEGLKGFLITKRMPDLLSLAEIIEKKKIDLRGNQSNSRINASTFEDNIKTLIEYITSLKAFDTINKTDSLNLAFAEFIKMNYLYPPKEDDLQGLTNIDGAFEKIIPPININKEKIENPSEQESDSEDFLWGLSIKQAIILFIVIFLVTLCIIIFIILNNKNNKRHWRLKQAIHKLDVESKRFSDEQILALKKEVKTIITELTERIGSNEQQLSRFFERVEWIENQKGYKNVAQTKPQANENYAGPIIKQTKKKTLTYYLPSPDPQGFFWDDKKTESPQSSSTYKMEVDPQNPSLGLYTLMTENEKIVRMALANLTMYLKPVCKILNNNTSGKSITVTEEGMLKLIQDKWVIFDDNKMKIVIN